MGETENSPDAVPAEPTESDTRELDPPAEADLREQLERVSARVEQLENYNTELEAKLIEQEHRLLPLWRNWFAHRDSEAPEDESELARWKHRRSASRWALLWRFISPETATTAGVSVIAVAGLWVAIIANEHFKDQNGLVDQQNEYFREQNTKLQQQIEAQADEAYLARRAALIATLYDRTACDRSKLEEAQEGDKPALCPLRASTRAREDALKAFVQMERARRPVPVMTGPDGPAKVHPIPLARVDLRGADLRGVDLRGADLTDADLRDAELRDAHLRGANLYDADLRDARLVRADLTGADLHGADLSEANMKGANLSNTRLLNTILTGAELVVVNLSGAELIAEGSGAEIRDVFYTESSQLRGMPEGINMILMKSPDLWPGGPATDP